MQRVSPRRVSPTPPRNSPPNKATAPSGAFCSRTPSPDVTEATARCPDAYLGLAGRLVDAARAVARRHFRQGRAIAEDRKSVVEGKRVTVRVDLGGILISNKKKKNIILN